MAPACGKQRMVIEVLDGRDERPQLIDECRPGLLKFDSEIGQPVPPFLVCGRSPPAAADHHPLHLQVVVQMYQVGGQSRR